MEKERLKIVEISIIVYNEYEDCADYEVTSGTYLFGPIKGDHDSILRSIEEKFVPGFKFTLGGSQYEVDHINYFDEILLTKKNKKLTIDVKEVEPLGELI